MAELLFTASFSGAFRGVIEGVIELIQISDCHLFKDKSKVGYGEIAPYQSLETVLRQVSQRIRLSKTKCAPDDAEHQTDDVVQAVTVILVTGDITGDDTHESYMHFLSLMSQHIDSIGVDWYVIAGNHDNNPHFERIFAKRILCSGHPVTIGDWQVHGMDTRCASEPHSAKGEVNSHDVRMVSRAIEQASSKHHLVALHHHIKPSNSWMDKHRLFNAERIDAMASKYTQIKGFIHGHVHHPLRQQVGGHETPSFGSPSTCWQWEMQTTFGVSESNPGYQVIQLHSDGSLSCEVYRTDSA